MENHEIQAGCLVIGEGVSVTGDFIVPDSAMIAGVVDGTLTAKSVFVATAGIVKGNLTADVIDVKGEVHKDVRADVSLFIRSTGKVSGDVKYAEIEIEKGASIEGSLNKTII